MSIEQTPAISDRRVTPDCGEAPHAAADAIARDRTQRTLATVLVIDVKDSTDLSREIELGDWWSLSAALFELMSEGIHKHGGWVGNFTGDGVNAVFEAGSEGDHHAWRACRAAMWIRDAIHITAPELRAAYGLRVSVRMGINSGEIMTGTIGRRYRRYYTAHGYPVALAKRMETLAHPQRIYLSEATAAEIRGAFHLRDQGVFAVKGANAPIRVFELVGQLRRFRPRTDVVAHHATSRQSSSHAHNLTNRSMRSTYRRSNDAAPASQI